MLIITPQLANNERSDYERTKPARRMNSVEAGDEPGILAGLWPNRESSVTGKTEGFSR
jgi:hypothetical protein